MSDKDEIDVEDDFASQDSDEAGVQAPAETSKANLNKRRTIDNLLEERRLKRQLADYDFDL